MVPDTGRLAGKAALVTGAGKGIGRGIARRFAREGAAVLVAEIDEAAGASVAAEIAELGGQAVFLPCDVREKQQVVTAVEETSQRFGSLDILVNNAIALSPNVVLEEKSDEMLSSVLTSGLWATWWAMRAALPAMRAAGGGRIINFYSIDAEAGAWLHSDYNAVKDAIRGLTRSAAMEWARDNVLVNAIAPAVAGNPLGRVGDPEEDIAPVAVFLASEDARYVTGETIHVDGGQHLPRYQSRPPGL
ncbi:SDR family NAD(P)-dependent oxidoreductase [Parafrankia elaeagni]|uniref:SDR family NAD(P)-dependent oxidoreductase n=1 Tax=Parafrankia elaeagni TaxID=222534 RepID=UPI000376C41C|nr:SDR family NAD(P)-dependent oxidoreductase [Parafrankia elaeagni]